MSFKCAIELTGGEGQCKDLLENHSIVKVVAEKNGEVVDSFFVTVEDLVEVDWVNPRMNERTAYLKLKSYVAKKQH